MAYPFLSAYVYSTSYFLCYKNFSFFLSNSPLSVLHHVRVNKSKSPYIRSNLSSSFPATCHLPPPLHFPESALSRDCCIWSAVPLIKVVNDDCIICRLRPEMACHMKSKVKPTKLFTEFLRFDRGTNYASISTELVNASLNSELLSFDRWTWFVLLGYWRSIANFLK